MSIAVVRKQEAMCISAVEAYVFRAPCPIPVRTSFGEMRERPAVFVKVSDSDGYSGWGEVWCNYPACGAEHRARLVQTVIAPLLVGQAVDGPSEATQMLQVRTAVLAIQSGEFGPISQVIAGLDVALWDLAARRAHLPLYRFLGGSDPSIRVYASGINPDGCVETARRAREEGYRGFKLKIGFDTGRDIENLRNMRAAIGDECMLMADANQAWSLDEALEGYRELDELNLEWIEEPLRADVPPAAWRHLRSAFRTPIAAGENVSSLSDFIRLIHEDSVRVIQPDVAKWGGISGCMAVARAAIAHGARYCPHYLGAGVGLAASGHLLAAVGGNGCLEIDANSNPLRTLTAGVLTQVSDGCVTLSEEPGIGSSPDLDRLGKFRCDV